MNNQNNNRKKTHTTYSITNTYTHTHINIDKYTQKTEMNGTICFLKQFFRVQTLMKPAFHHWFPQNGAWTALKPAPNVLKNPHEPAFHPWVFQKGAWTAPKPPPTKKKKSGKKRKNSQNNSAPFLWRWSRLTDSFELLDQQWRYV